MDRDRIRDFARRGEDRTDRHLGDLSQPPRERLVLGRRHGDGENSFDDVEADGERFRRDLMRQLLHRLVVTIEANGST